MSASPSGWASGVLLIVAGIWLLLQTLKGGLVNRITGSNTPASSPGGSSSPPSSSSSPDSPQGNLNINPAPNPGSTATPGTQPSPGYSPYVPPAYLGGDPGGAPGTTPIYTPTPAPAANIGNPKSPPAPY